MAFTSVLLFLNYCDVLAIALVLMMHSLKMKYHYFLSQDEYWNVVLDNPRYYRFSFHVAVGGAVFSVAFCIAGLSLFVPQTFKKIQDQHMFYDAEKRTDLYTWNEETTSIASLNPVDMGPVRLLEFIQAVLRQIVQWVVAVLRKKDSSEDPLSVSRPSKTGTIRWKDFLVSEAGMDDDIAEEVDFADNIENATCDGHNPSEENIVSEQDKEVAWQVDDSFGFFIRTSGLGKSLASMRLRRMLDIGLLAAISFCLSVAMIHALIATEFLETNMRWEQYKAVAQARERRSISKDTDYIRLSNIQSGHVCQYFSVAAYPPSFGWTNTSCLEFYHREFVIIRRLALTGVIVPTACFLVVVPFLMSENTTEHCDSSAQTRPRNNWVRGCGDDSKDNDLGIQCDVEEKKSDDMGDEPVIVFPDDDFRRLSLKWLVV